MEQSRFDRVLDYFPLLAYAGFWLQGGLLSAIATGELRLLALGVVTLPAVAALLLAARRISRKHRERAD